MQMRSLFPVILFTLCSAGVKAQQVFKISQYTQHNFLYNPAAAGANDAASVGAVYKKMWSGIAGGPQTTFLFGDKYFAKKKVGVAVSLYADKTGPTSRTGGQVSLSYSIDMQNGKRLMFGLEGQFIQFKVDKDAIQDAIPGDPLLASSGSTFKGDAGAGVYYKSSGLNVGFSAKQLLQTKLNLIKGTTGEQGKLYRHYFLMAHYNIKTDEDNILVPNLLFKYLPNAPLEFEGGVRLEHKDLIWVGFNYHYQQSFSAFAGIKLEHKFAIGYAFDLYNTPVSLFTEGSGSAHEISLRYFFIK